MSNQNLINTPISLFPMKPSFGFQRPLFYLDSDDAGESAPNEPEKKEDKPNQEDLNKKFADRAKRAEEANTKKILESLGVKDLDEAKALTEAARKATEAQKTDLEKAETARLEAETKAQKAEEAAQAKLDAANKRVLDSEIKINAAAPVMDKDGKKVVRPAFRKEALDDVLLLIGREAITEEDGKYSNIDKALSDLAKAKPWLLDESAPVSKGSPSESGRQLKKQDGTQERAPIIRSL